MLSVEDALKLVLARCRVKPPELMAAANALQLVLAEDVASDIDSPPHDKAMMDGYAVVASDLSSAQCDLAVLEEVTAGMVPSCTVVPGSATRIMTGAPIPRGADAVVMIERTEFLPVEPDEKSHQDVLGRVRIREPGARAGLNILPRATSLRRGETVLTAGTRLRPIEIGLLAEVGRVQVHVIPPAYVAVLATGNELVPAGYRPTAGLIRNSNSPMLVASARKAGAVAKDLGIARDDWAELRRLIAESLKSDVLILSGGVSAGTLDLVPSVLKDLGVEEVFHKVRLKPGKPLWFGAKAKGEVRKAEDGEEPSTTLVFALPGNPVSSLVCFELFIRPAIDCLAGRWQEATRCIRGRLATEFQHRGDRPTYFPAMLTSDEQGHLLTPVNWKGSADLRSLALANALILFPAGDRTYPAGEPIEAMPL